MTSGAAYLKIRARSRFARGRGVYINHLTSWMGLPEMVKYAWSLRSVPGGWLSLLMLFTGIIAILHQFLTNTLVTPALIPTRCIFDYGVVWNGTSWSSLPASDDESANLVYQAQLATLKNEGTRGIYHKFLADNEIQMFRPSAAETHGAWHCTNVKNDSMSWTGPVIVGGVSTRRTAGGIPPKDWSLYLNSSAYTYWSGPGEYAATTVGERYNMFMMWSSNSTTHFKNVKAAILNEAGFVRGKALAMNFDCSLTLNQSVPLLDVQNVLTDWMGKAYGYQKSLTTEKETQLWLELTLDAITTLSLFNDALTAHNIVPAGEIGCVVDGTKASVGILMFLGLMVIILAYLLTVQLASLYAAIRHPTKHCANRLPFDLADWQLATYRRDKKERASTFRELHRVSVRYDSLEESLCMETQFTDSAGDQATLPVYPAKFDYFDHGFVEYHNRGMNFPINNSFHNPRKPEVRTYARIASETSHYSLDGSTHEALYADNRWLLGR